DDSESDQHFAPPRAGAELAHTATDSNRSSLIRASRCVVTMDEWPSIRCSAARLHASTRGMNLLGPYSPSPAPSDVLPPARDYPREAGHPDHATLAKAAEPAPQALAQRSTPCGRERVVQIVHRHLRLHAHAVVERAEGGARVDPFLAHFFEARATHESGQPPRPRKPQRMRDGLGIRHRARIEAPAQASPNRDRRVLLARPPYGERGASAGPQHATHVTECRVEIGGEHHREA